MEVACLKFVLSRPTKILHDKVKKLLDSLIVVNEWTLRGMVGEKQVDITADLLNTFLRLPVEDIEDDWSADFVADKISSMWYLGHPSRILEKRNFSYPHKFLSDVLGKCIFATKPGCYFRNCIWPKQWWLFHVSEKSIGDISFLVI